MIVTSELGLCTTTAPPDEAWGFDPLPTEVVSKGVSIAVDIAMGDTIGRKEEQRDGRLEGGRGENEAAE